MPTTLLRCPVVPRLALACALLAGSAATALGDPPTGPAGEREYKVYWAVSSGAAAAGERWRDWAAAVQFGEAPIHRDMQVFYEWNMGHFPKAGMHVVELDSNYMTRHLTLLRQTVAQQFPDPNATGYGVIDYEHYTPSWDFIINVPSNQGPLALDGDYKDDWRDYIREYRPQILTGLTPEQQEVAFEQTFNETARRFYLDTLNECKRLRPLVKWGYYLYPPRRYYDFLRADRLVAWQERHRRELTWLYNEMDAFFPDIYSLYYTVESNPNYRIGQDSQEEASMYITGNIVETRAVSNGKPVIAFACSRYTINAGNWQHLMCSPRNMRNQFELPKLAGADGVAIWDAISSEARFRELQEYTTAQIVPLVMEFATDVPPPPAPPPAPPPPAPPPNPGDPPPPAPPPPAPPPTPPPGGPDGNRPTPTPPPPSPRPTPDDPGSRPPPPPPGGNPGDPNGGGPTPAPLPPPPTPQDPSGLVPTPTPPPQPGAEPTPSNPGPTPTPRSDWNGSRRGQDPPSNTRRDRRSGGPGDPAPSNPPAPVPDPAPEASSPPHAPPPPAADEGVIRIEIRSSRNAARGGPFTPAPLTGNRARRPTAQPLMTRTQMTRMQNASLGRPVQRQSLGNQLRPARRFANRVVGSPDRSSVVNELRRARENRLPDGLADAGGR